MMTVSWGGICCSSPPCVTISIREATYTYGNIMEKRVYILNVPSEAYAKEADYYGMVSCRKVDKFKETGLTPVRSKLVDAPYVDEFPMVLECKVIHVYEIGLHTQFIGEVLDVKIDSSVVSDDGSPDIQKIRPFVISPEVGGYNGVNEIIGRAFVLGKSSQKGDGID